jgi:parallel beta-helix repeat protein
MKTRWLGLLLLIGCNGLPDGADYYVEPSGGDDTAAIQTAFVSAQDGEVVLLAAGTFHLTDAIEVSGLANFTLRGEGMEETILDFTDQMTGGDGITMMNMTDVTVEDLAIIDAPGDGLTISSSDGIVVRGVSVGWSEVGRVENGKYGIYPVNSSNVLIEDSETFGASDAGFYVGQVTNCIVRNNYAYGNVAAYEIENSVNCEVTDNLAENNVGGFLVMELPTAPARGRGTLVANNVARTNNLYNFAEEGAAVELIPRGTGVFIIAGNEVEVRDNEITGNEGMGIGVVSWGAAMALGEGGALPDDYDPWAEDIYIHDNTLSNNGGVPGGEGDDDDDPLWLLRAALGGLGVDISMGLEPLLWDGLLEEGNTADTLCIQNNGSATFRNLDIIDLASGNPDTMSTTDLTPHDCVGVTRQPVVLE